MKSKNTTTFQISILFFLLINSLFAIAGYKTFLNLSFKNTIISIILGTILGLLLFNAYFFIFKKINIKKIINKKIVKIVALILLSITLSFLIYRFAYYIHYIYLNKNNLIFITFTLLLLFLYTFHLDHFILSRTLEILLYIFLFFFIVKVIGLIPYVDISYLLPIANNNYQNIILSSFLFAILTSSVLSLLYIFYNKEINEKKVKYYFTVAYITACLFILINYILIIGILGNHLANIYTYPETMVLKSINFFNFIERVDYILAMEYLIGIYSLISILLHNIKKIMSSFHNHFLNKCMYLFIILLFLISILFN